MTTASVELRADANSVTVQTAAAAMDARDVTIATEQTAATTAWAAATTLT